MAGEVPPNEKLRVAAGKGDVDAIKDLCTAGAKFDVDKYGRTALHYAAHFGHTAAMKQCMTLGCALNVQDSFGCTALHKSVMEGHSECAMALLEERCDVEAREENGHTALHEACWNGYSRTVDALVKIGKANIHATNKNGQKPIHLAVQNGHNETTRVLLKAGTNPDVRNNENGETPLHVAAMFGHVTCTRILLSAGGNASSQNKCKGLPDTKQTVVPEVIVVAYRRLGELDMKEAEDVGNTPLHIAAGLNKKKVTRVLIESGCSTHLRNRNNQLPLELARNNDHADIVLLILSAHKIKKAAKKSFFSRKKKQISDESRDSSSDLTSYKARSHKEKLDESTLGSSSPRVKGRRELGSQSFKAGEDSEDKRSRRRSRDSDSKDSRGYRSNKETRKRREKERDKQRLEEDNKMAQGMFAKDELRRRIEREKKIHYDVQVGRLTGDPHRRMQYVKDKNGKVIEIPLSFNCQCTPYIRKLENQIEATKEGLLHEIDMSRSKFDSRMRNLDKRMSHQAQCLDQLSRERVAAERTECLHRIDRRAGEERALLQEEQEARIEILRGEMKHWFEERIQPLHEQLTEMYVDDSSEEEEERERGGQRTKNGTSLYQDSGMGISRTQSDVSLNGTGGRPSAQNGRFEETDSPQRRRNEIKISQLRRHLSERDVDQMVEEDYVSRGARPKETRTSGTTTNDNRQYQDTVNGNGGPLVSAAYRPPLVSTQERMFSVTGRARTGSPGAREQEQVLSQSVPQGYMMSNHISDQSSNDDSSESDSDMEVTETKSQATMSLASSAVKGSLVNGRARSETGLRHPSLTSSHVAAASTPAVRNNLDHVSTPQNPGVTASSKKPFSSAMSSCSSSGISSAKSASLVSSAHRHPQLPPPPRQFSAPVQVHQEPNLPANWRNRPRQVADVPPNVGQSSNNRQTDRGREWRSSDVSSQSSVSSFKLAMKNGRELQL